VWTDDGRPYEKTAKYGAVADVFGCEGQLDTPTLQALSYRMLAELLKYTIDSWHTMYYAAGYLVDKLQPLPRWIRAG
jgi:ribonuclease Z